MIRARVHNEDMNAAPRPRRRPVKTTSDVWCDFHGCIHRAERNPYGFEEPDCKPCNWRPVYILGDPGEVF